MFERFTVKARQSVFFARYAASQLGSPHIESGHFLLGILRADTDLAMRLARDTKSLDAIRKRIEEERPKRAALSTSMDLPLSNESMRAMALAAEEAAALHHDHIGAEHLLLGLMRVGESFAAGLLRDMPITLERLRAEANRTAAGPAAPGEAGSEWEHSPAVHIEGARDLTHAARQNALDPVIGRERELELIIAVLSRRRRNCPALIGEPGAGKSAMVNLLAHRLADDAVQFFQGWVLLSIEAAALAWKRGRMVDPLETALAGNVILCVEGLFDTAEADHLVAPLLFHGARVIGTGTVGGFSKAAVSLTQYFAAVEVAAASEAETLAILAGVKESYERFHQVSIRDDALPAAIRAARGSRSARALPDRALDVLDEACARARVRKSEVVTGEDVGATRRAGTTE